MGNKQQKETSSIGDVLCRKADEINRQNFMVGPVIERLKSASSQGKYFVEATSEEMGPLGVQILQEQKLIVESISTGYRIYIRKL